MSKSLTPAQLREAARAHNVEPAALRAVVLVESGGSGFLADGRPKILFERHWLYKRLRTRGIDPAPLARARPDLCGSRWDRRYYKGGAAEYDRIEDVIGWGGKRDPERWESYKKAALESASWGLFQLMGFHFAAVGCADIYEFKHAHEESEERQLQLILKWMQGNGLLERMRRRQWVRFVTAYNGPGAVPTYTAKLMAAYSRAKREGY